MIAPSSTSSPPVTLSYSVIDITPRGVDADTEKHAKDESSTSSKAVTVAAPSHLYPVLYDSASDQFQANMSQETATAATDKASSQVSKQGNRPGGGGAEKNGISRYFSLERCLDLPSFEEESIEKHIVRKAVREQPSSDVLRLRFKPFGFDTLP
jgi:hypothetical protein